MPRRARSTSARHTARSQVAQWVQQGQLAAGDDWQQRGGLQVVVEVLWPWQVHQ